MYVGMYVGMYVYIYIHKGYIPSWSMPSFSYFVFVFFVFFYIFNSWSVLFCSVLWIGVRSRYLFIYLFPLLVFFGGGGDVLWMYVYVYRVSVLGAGEVR